MRKIALTVVFCLAAACNPVAFDDIKNSASTRVLLRPDGFSSAFPFGSTLTAYEVTVDGQRESRFAVGGGPGAPVYVYQGWARGGFRLDAHLFDACDESGDCLAGAGGALIGLPVWRATSPEPREACLMITAPDEGGFSVKCESTPLIENIRGTMADIDLGASGVSLGAGSTIGVALLGAPRANGGAGGIFRVEDGLSPTEMTLPPGTAPPGSRLGTDMDAVIIDPTRALVAATAPEGGRVVVLTAMSDGTVTVHACIDDPSAGFAGSIALGDVDGDGATDVVIGNDRTGADEIRVYPGSGMPVSGCGAWGSAPITIACPTVEGITCNGSGFGVDVAVGDMTGDGIDDIAIGAPAARVSEEERGGAVFFVPGAVGGPDVGRATARSHSQPGVNDEIGSSVVMFASGLDTSPRMEPVGAAVGREAVLAFLCSGLDGDVPTSDLVGELCAPR